MSVVKAYIIYTMIQNVRSALTWSDQLSFRRDTCRTYRRLGKFRLEPGEKTFGLPRNPADVRYFRHGHFTVKRTEQRKCKAIDCSPRPRTYCSKCNIICVSAASHHTIKSNSELTYTQMHG